MSGVVLDGKKINQEILSELRPRIAALTSQKRAPALAVVLVGRNPASQIYVRNKVRTCYELGIRSIGESENPLASRERARVPARIHDFAGEIVPKYKRKTRREDLFHVPFANLPVDWVYGCEGDLHDHVACAEARHGYVLILQLF